MSIHSMNGRWSLTDGMRMTHEKDLCPILIHRREEAAAARRAGGSSNKQKKIPILKESDPLFGVLGENQVGIDPSTEG